MTWNIACSEGKTFTMFMMNLLLTFSFGSQEVVIKVNCSSLMRDKERGVGFAGFKKHEHRYLNVAPMTFEFVKTVKECALLTAMHYLAFSFNFAVHPNVHGLHRCELLDTDLFNNTDKLTNNTAYNHYSIGSPCAESPCLNGGSCVARYTSNDYSCNCLRGFTGRSCEKAEIPPAYELNWTEWQGKYYKVFKTAMNWNDAVTACREHGSNLTSIKSLQENTFLLSLVKGTVNADKYVWIGLNDIAKERTHEWVDGEQGSYRKWGYDQPNDNNAQENCVDFSVQDGVWYDFGCYQLEGFICKYVP